MLDGSVSQVRLPQVRCEQNRPVVEVEVPYEASGEKGGQLAGCFEGEDHGGGREQGKAENCSTEVNVADVGRTEIPLEGSRWRKARAGPHLTVFFKSVLGCVPLNGECPSLLLRDFVRLCTPLLLGVPLAQVGEGRLRSTRARTGPALFVSWI